MDPVDGTIEIGEKSKDNCWRCTLKDGVKIASSLLVCCASKEEEEPVRKNANGFGEDAAWNNV